MLFETNCLFHELSEVQVLHVQRKPTLEKVFEETQQYDTTLSHEQPAHQERR